MAPPFPLLPPYPTNCFPLWRGICWLLYFPPFSTMCPLRPLQPNISFYPWPYRRFLLTLTPMSSSTTHAPLHPTSTPWTTSMTKSANSFIDNFVAFFHKSHPPFHISLVTRTIIFLSIRRDELLKYLIIHKILTPCPLSLPYYSPTLPKAPFLDLSHYLLLQCLRVASNQHCLSPLFLLHFLLQWH